MKNHKPWIITAKGKDEIEILLYEVIGRDMWTGEGTTAKSFAEDLKAAGPGIRKIHLRVNSPGGSVFDGIAIYNTLLSHGAKVTATVDGLCASIASTITMAASEISMGDNAIMMIHNPYTMIGGDAHDMRKMADTMDKVKASMITAYQRHTTKSAEEVAMLMDDETWMTAEEAVENGFAEKVTTPQGDEADVAANFAPMLAKFRKVPQQIAARFGAPRPPRILADDDPEDPCQCGCVACVKGDCSACVTADCEDAACDDCPMQEAKAAAGKKAIADLAVARAELAAATDRVKALQAAAKLHEKEMERHSLEAQATEAARGEDRHREKSWLTRMGGELEQSAALYATASSALTRRSEAAQELLRAGILPRLETAQALLARLKSERTGEITRLGKWSERVGAELRQAALPLAGVQEIARQSGADAETVGGLIPQIEATETLLGRLKAERTAELAALRAWTGRVSAELTESGTLHQSAMEEMTRHAQQSGELAQKIEAAETLLAKLTTDRASELTALGHWTERLYAELGESGQLQASALEEITRRSSETAGAGRMEKIEAAEKTLAARKAERIADLAAARRWTKTVKADLDQSVALHGSLLKTMAQRSHAAEQLARGAEAHAADARTALLPAALIQMMEAEAKTRREEADAWKSWIEGLKAGCEESVQLQAAAAQELGRRSLLAEADETADPITAVESLLAEWKAGQAAEGTALARIGEALTASAKVRAGVADELSRRALHAEPGSNPDPLAEAAELLGQVKSGRAAEVAGSAALLTTLQQSGELRASAAEELFRRQRLLETQDDDRGGEIAAAETMLAALKTQRTAAARATAQLVDGLTAEMKAAAERHASVADDLSRRARLAESSSDLDGIGSAETLVGELKELLTAELATQAVCLEAATDLSKAGDLYHSAVEEIERRGRLAAL